MLPIRRRCGGERRAVNYVAHFAIGTMWGLAYAATERAGLRGQKAVGTVLGAVYTGDALLNRARVVQPWRWSAQDWAVDLGEKLLQAEATAFAYNRLAPS